MVFLAVNSSTDSTGEIAGKVRTYSHRNDATSEFAIRVRGDMKQHGLGRALLQNNFRPFPPTRPHKQSSHQTEIRCGTSR